MGYEDTLKSLGLELPEAPKPDTTGIVFVQMPDGQAARYQRCLVRIVGKLHLNTTDPEDFMYSVKDARVGAID